MTVHITECNLLWFLIGHQNNFLAGTERIAAVLAGDLVGCHVDGINILVSNLTGRIYSMYSKRIAFIAIAVSVERDSIPINREIRFKVVVLVMFHSL